MKILQFASCLAIVLSLNSACFADIQVYDNGVGGPSGVDSAQVSDDDFPFLLADDFVLVSTSILTSISWTGAYIFLNTPPVDNFDIYLFQDTGSGSPQNSPFATFNIGSSADRSISGATIFGFDVYEYEASIPNTLLNAGEQYWLAIANDTTGDVDDWFWGADLDAGNSAGRILSGAWSPTDHALDFRLNAIPEPAVGMVCLLGFCGFLARRRSRC